MFEFKGKTFWWKTTRIKIVLKYNEIKKIKCLFSDIYIYIYIYIYIHGNLFPHPPWRWGVGLFFRTSEVSTFSYEHWGDSFIWGIWGESQLRISLRGTPVPISCQIGKCRSIKVNLPNCHREWNFIKWSPLMSLHLCDNLIKCYFDKLGRVFIHWV